MNGKKRISDIGDQISGGERREGKFENGKWKLEKRKRKAGGVKPSLPLKLWLGARRGA
jgi:hypothetical protein